MIWEMPSCRECTKPPPLVPDRSTFSYPRTATANRYISNQESIANQNNWNTFEAIENTNSAILKQLANTVPKVGSGINERVWHQFTDDAEKTAYRLGQLAHVAAFPTVSDFTVPYSNRPIPYISSVISSIKSLPPNECVNCPCLRPVTGKPISSDEKLTNTKALNTYVKVSTQTGLYPKSPYRFTSSDEYLLYKRYVSMNNVQTT